jgi:hypothetical protein
VNRKYDVFECLPDGSVLWRGTAHGLIAARTTLLNLAKKSPSEFFAILIETGEIVFRADTLRSDNEIAKRVFQIAYGEQMLAERAAIPRGHGYGVMSVLGNEAAQAILVRLPANGGEQVGLFILGHGAPEQTRLEMVHWLRAKYPDARILALNPPEYERLDELKYNARYDSPETWLPLAALAAG